jgi:hypothetical protein
MIDKLYIDTERIAPADKNAQFTPSPWLDFAREVFGAAIELDPASCEIANEVVKAKRFYSASDNAFLHDWRAKTVWFNPPYSNGLIEPMIDKFINSLSRIEQAIVLVNSSTSAAWYQALCGHCDAMLMPNRRINFWTTEGCPSDLAARARYQASPPGSNRYDQSLFYFGENHSRFASFSGGLGAVMLPKSRSHSYLHSQKTIFDILEVA